MEFREKIDNILAIKKITVTKLSQISGIGDTLQKAYRDNREMSRTLTERFLHKMGINSTWWYAREGEIFLSDVAKPAELGMRKESFYRELIEDNEEYSLIPRAVLKEYKIVPEKIIDMIYSDKEELKNALISKYEMIISNMEREVNHLRSRLGES
jgi:hypothetical protein